MKVTEIVAFQRAWSRHMDRAIANGWAFWAYPKSVRSRYVVEVLAYLSERKEEECYTYRMCRVLSHDHPNLIRRLKQWEKLGILYPRELTYDTPSGKPHRYYTLTPAGAKLGRLAVQARDSAEWEGWLPRG